MNDISGLSQEQSVTSLVRGILRDIQQLLKQQADLIRHEVRDDLRKAREGAVFLGVGLVITLVGGTLLCLLPPFLLNWLVPELPLWACFGIVGLVFLIVGACVVWAASQKFRSAAALPASVETLRENLTWTLKPR